MGLVKKTEKRFKRLVPGLLTSMLKEADRTRALPGLESLRRILIVRPEKLGDVMVTLPVVQALLDDDPERQVDMIVSPYSQALVKYDPRLTNVFVYGKRPLRDLRLIRMLQARDYDCVIDLIDADSVTGLLLSQWAAGIAVRIGNNKHRFARYYDLVNRNPRGHSIDRSLQVLELIGPNLTSCEKLVPPACPESAQVKASALNTELRRGDIGRLLCYNLSAGKATRLWPVEKCRALVRDLREAFPDDHLLLIVAPSDRQRGVETAAGFDNNVSLIPEGWSILDVAALTAHVDLLISPDTSLVHIARSFRVPVVGMYPRPKWNLERWRPYDQTGGVIISGDDGNIFDIRPPEVVAEALKMAPVGEGARQ